MICMVCMIARKDGFLQTMHSRKIMQIMHFMPSAPLPTRKQTVKKVPTGRHARTVGTHTGKFGAESVRAALRRVRGSAPNFVPRGILGGRNFCRATARRNGFPLKRGAFATRCKRKAFWLLYLSLNKAHRNGAAAFLLQGLEGPHDQESFSRFFSLHAGCVHCFSSRDAGWSRLTRYRKMIVDVEQTFLRYMRKGGRL